MLWVACLGLIRPPAATGSSSAQSLASSHALPVRTVEHITFLSNSRPPNGRKEHAEPNAAVRGLAAAASVLQKMPAAATATTAALCILPEVEAATPLFISLPILAEAAHHIYSSVGSRVFPKSTARHTLPERNAEEQLELWQQCLDDPTVSTEDFIRGWFLPASRSDRPTSGDEMMVTLEELRRDNVADWLAYALYAMAPQHLDDIQSAIVNAALTMLESRLTDELFAPNGSGGSRSRKASASVDPASGGDVAAGGGGGGGSSSSSSSSSAFGGSAVSYGTDADDAESRVFRFPPGHNDQLVGMRLNVDAPNTNMLQRPLLYYALTDGVLGGLVTPHLMRQRGFTRHHAKAPCFRYTRQPGGSGGLSYWYHPGEEPLQEEDMSSDQGGTDGNDVPAELLERTFGQGRSASNEGKAAARKARPRGLGWRKRRREGKRGTTPLVFVHGVGLGPLPYKKFIDEMLKRADGAPMLVIELPFVAQRLSAIGPVHAPHEVRTAAEIAEAMDRHGIERATFVGHSLGTIYLAWMARTQPARLASCVFIDPIVFLLHHHKVAQSFLYSRPQKRDALGAVERYFIKSEHSIISYFHRHFYWCVPMAQSLP